MREEPDNQSYWLGIAWQGQACILKLFRTFPGQDGTKLLEYLALAIRRL
jgi:hypothetical protein